MNGLTSCYAKFSLLIIIISFKLFLIIGLIMDSQNRESSLLAKINSLAEQIRYVDSVPETESQFQQLQDISDGEEM